MATFQSSIPIGLGDLIFIKSQLDFHKDKFNEIKINFHKELIEKNRGVSSDYGSFLREIGNLFFSDHPYQITEQSYPYRSQLQICSDYGIEPVKPNLQHLLCKGKSLNIDPYIVLSTKIRNLPRKHFNNKSNDLWKALNEISNKYKIVLIGERMVEMNSEYLHHTEEHIYGIYNDIIKNISSKNLIDLTVPALGITTPSLSKIQQDCLILKESEFAITLGIGGNFCMAVATANVIGYRFDNDTVGDFVFKDYYDNAKITKNWEDFIKMIREYR